jgi:hypothetical protein
MLYAVLKEAKKEKETWYIRDYDDAIINLVGKDKK